MTLGDFNVVSNVEERTSGVSSSYRDMDEFNKDFEKSELLLVDFKGFPFTWTIIRMWQRLDM